MKLSIGLIIDYLKQRDLSMNSVNIADNYAIIADYLLCEDSSELETHETHEDILFVCLSRCDGSCLCKKYIKHVITFDPLDRTYDHLSTNIMLEQTNEEKVIDMLHILFTGYFRWYEKLLHMILQKKSLQSILNYASEKLTNPIALLDNQMMFMASAGNFKQDVKGTIWDFIGEPTFSLANFFTVEEQQKLTKLTQRNNGKPSLYIPQKDPEHTYLTSNLWLDGTLVASIGMVDINEIFTDGQIYLVDQIREIILLYFSNNQQLMRMAEGNLHFVELILEGKDIYPDNVQFYLNRMGWLLHERYSMCLLSAPVEILTLVEGTSYIRLLNQHFPKAMVVLYDKNIVMISRVADYSFNEINDFDLLKSLCEEQKLKCGISSEFMNFMSIKYIYTQAEFALNSCIDSIDHMICKYEDYQIMHVIKSLSTRSDPRAYCHPKLIELWESDNIHDKELIRNLYTYLVHGKNITEAAKESYIHRNTLIYRINKLNEFLGVELSNVGSSEIFYYLITCIILEFLS